LVPKTPVTDDFEKVKSFIYRLEDEVFSKSNCVNTQQMSNESKRYCRIGYLNFYMDYLNKSLENLQQQEVINGPTNSDATREELLKLGMQLHFAFCSCHSASTAHLSILHMCYELASILHSRSLNKNKTIIQVRYWTEQLKNTHMIRYGALGNDLSQVRNIMKHTQNVLRNRNSLETASYEFI